MGDLTVLWWMLNVPRRTQQFWEEPQVSLENLYPLATISVFMGCSTGTIKGSSKNLWISVWSEELSREPWVLPRTTFSHTGSLGNFEASPRTSRGSSSVESSRFFHLYSVCGAYLRPLPSFPLTGDFGQDVPMVAADPVVPGPLHPEYKCRSQGQTHTEGPGVWYVPYIKDKGQGHDFSEGEIHRCVQDQVLK